MPLASAVRTKSSLLTSCTAARVMRVMIASGIVPSATAGRTRCLTASQAAGRSPVRTPSRTKKPVGWSVVMRDVLPARAAAAARAYREDVLEQEPEREHRDRDPEQRADGRGVVDPAVRSVGRRRSRAGCRPRRRTAMAASGQLDGGREAPAGSPPRPAAGSGWRRRSRPGRPCPCTSVLLVQRPVEAVRRPHLRGPLGRRPLTEQRRLRSAGQGPDEQEDQDRQPEQDRDQQEQAADGELQQGVSAP